MRTIAGSEGVGGEVRVLEGGVNRGDGHVGELAVGLAEGVLDELAGDAGEAGADGIRGALRVRKRKSRRTEDLEHKSCWRPEQEQ